MKISPWALIALLPISSPAAEICKLNVYPRDVLKSSYSDTGLKDLPWDAIAKVARARKLSVAANDGSPMRPGEYILVLDDSNSKVTRTPVDFSKSEYVVRGVNIDYFVSIEGYLAKFVGNGKFEVLARASGSTRIESSEGQRYRLNSRGERWDDDSYAENRTRVDRKIDRVYDQVMKDLKIPVCNGEKTVETIQIAPPTPPAEPAAEKPFGSIGSEAKALQDRVRAAQLYEENPLPPGTSLACVHFGVSSKNLLPPRTLSGNYKITDGSQGPELRMGSSSYSLTSTASNLSARRNEAGELFIEIRFASTGGASPTTSAFMLPSVTDPERFAATDYLVCKALP